MHSFVEGSYQRFSSQPKRSQWLGQLWMLGEFVLPIEVIAGWYWTFGFDLTLLRLAIMFVVCALHIVTHDFAPWRVSFSHYILTEFDHVPILVFEALQLSSCRCAKRSGPAFDPFCRPSNYKLHAQRIELNGRSLCQLFRSYLRHTTNLASKCSKNTWICKQ